MSPSSQCASIDGYMAVTNRQPKTHGASKVLIDRYCRDQGNQTLFVAESPHFVTHLLILVIIPSFLHFLITPDETNNSELAVANSAVCGALDNFWLNDCAIGALLIYLSHACVAADGRSRTRKNPNTSHTSSMCFRCRYRNGPKKRQSSPCRLA